MRLQLLFPQDLPHRASDLGATGPVRAAAWSERETGRTANQFALLDRFFGVTRVAGAPAFLADSARSAQQSVCTHVVTHASSMSLCRLAQLLSALELVHAVAGSGLMVAPRPAPALPALSGPTGTSNPHLSWRVGHLAFFPLIQGALVGLRTFMSAADDGDDENAVAALRFAADCLSGSIRAMEFAADFSPAEYRSQVRPTMAPPFLPEGLSGLMSADHHHLVKTFPAAAWLARQSAPEVQCAYDAVVAVVESSYAAHVHVCDRFQGAATTSLRMAPQTQMSATEVIVRMGRSRVEGLRR